MSFVDERRNFWRSWASDARKKPIDICGFAILATQTLTLLWSLQLHTRFGSVEWNRDGFWISSLFALWNSTEHTWQQLHVSIEQVSFFKKESFVHKRILRKEELFFFYKALERSFCRKKTFFIPLKNHLFEKCSIQQQFQTNTTLGSQPNARKLNILPVLQIHCSRAIVDLSDRRLGATQMGMFSTFITVVI